MNRRLIVRYILLFFYITIPIVLLILPSTFFDSGPEICLSKVLLGTECIGCGLTRGIQHLIHFDFSAAYSYNKLSFAVFPFIVFLWARGFYKDGKYILENRKVA